MLAAATLAAAGANVRQPPVATPYAGPAKLPAFAPAACGAATAPAAASVSEPPAAGVTPGCSGLLAGGAWPCHHVLRSVTAGFVGDTGSEPPHGSQHSWHRGCCWGSCMPRAGKRRGAACLARFSRCRCAGLLPGA